jgi:ubiquinone/menaquinone biosynthesis C-methylase UbiE/uncharacterized protein YbaR (Trm112 family)
LPFTHLPDLFRHRSRQIKLTRRKRSLERLPWLTHGNALVCEYEEVIAMRHDSVELLCCPVCFGELTLQEPQVEDGIIWQGSLYCEKDDRTYPIQSGIPQFIAPQELLGLDRKYEKLYNLIARFYDSEFFITEIVRQHFVPAGEEKARLEIIERLELRSGDKVLETGIGTGSNVPYIYQLAPDVDVYGLDISLGMLKQGVRNLKKWGVETEFFLGNGEALPFGDEAFDVVFHVGGINAFTEIRRAIDEMIRVAKPGSRIVIADETEDVTDGLFSKIGFHLFFGKRLAEEILEFRADDMLKLVPPEMKEVAYKSIWEGNGYLLEFRKP